MQAILMAVSLCSARKNGCILCGSNFKELELVIKISHTWFLKCLRCPSHTEFIALERGIDASEIEVRVRRCPILIKPRLLPHPRPRPQKPKKGTKITQEL